MAMQGELQGAVEAADGQRLALAGPQQQCAERDRLREGGHTVREARGLDALGVQPRAAAPAHSRGYALCRTLLA